MVPVKTVCIKLGTNTKFGINNVVLTMVENLTISVPCLALRRQMVPAIKFVTQNEDNNSGMLVCFMNFGTKI